MMLFVRKSGWGARRVASSAISAYLSVEKTSLSLLLSLLPWKSCCPPMVREKDVCWEYADKLDGNKVRCKFCQRVLNGGISRLKHHLSRLPSKGVNPCSKVRDDVSDRVRAIIAPKEDVKENSSVKKQKLPEVKAPSPVSATKALLSIDAASPLMKSFLTVSPMTPPSVNHQENAEKSIALFFFENKLDFSVARSSSYQLMIDAIGKCGPGFIGPSAEMLKTTWLERIKSEVGLQSKDVEKEWVTTDWVSRCVLQAHTISKFIYNNALLLDLMKKFTGGQELIRTGITKSVSTFLSLQSLLKQKSRLKHMFHSPEYVSNSLYENKPHSLSCVAIAEDLDFWRTVDECVAIAEPFLKVLREVSEGKPTVEDFYKVLEKLLPVPDMRRDITNQIYTFTKAHGMFGCSLAKEARTTVSPWLWWEQYGDSAPGLQRVAIRILSQVCSTFSFQRHWSTFQQIHSEKRNKIDRETLNDLVYINYNLKLARQMKAKSSEADPLQFDDIDMTSEWVEESENTSPTQWLDRFGPALDASDLNTRQFSSAIFGANDPIFGL
ncbi:hypothetical protein K1719_040463 [Acacia pycnantha]|nr:hypothetical protein K1719_040463 [Acacia pycnantha]